MPEGHPTHHPIFEKIELGIGTWSWGDRMFWGYGKSHKDIDIKEGFEAGLAAGITFFDTAEVYGQGKSETILGRLEHESGKTLTIATKFMPFPWRLSRSSLKKALHASLKRLGRSRVELYQIHWPWPPLTIETWSEALADALQAGLTGAVGVSNFDQFQMQRAQDVLAREGIKLTSNQVEFNLLNRQAEQGKLLAKCHELGTSLIAYSPLAMGLLTGKYTPQNPPPGIRGQRFNQRLLVQIQPLISLLRKIGADHAGKTPAQVALNWIICKGAIPIPGVKNLQQAEQNVGALGWRLTAEEVAQLDEASDKIGNQSPSSARPPMTTMRG